ncbi:hypothetical protein SEUCBS139899_000755 [Sporothrix eucalyptigena]
MFTDEEEMKEAIFIEIEDMINATEESSYLLCVTTRDPPKNPEKGFVFGRADDCDIRLNGVNIEDHQFAVSIDYHFRTVSIKDLSRNGTKMTVRHRNSRVQVRKRSSEKFEVGSTVDVDLGRGATFTIKRDTESPNWSDYCRLYAPPQRVVNGWQGSEKARSQISANSAKLNK